MKRVASIVLVFGLAGCAFAQKHPAITTGIVAGSIGFTTCFMAVEKPGTCGVVGLGAGVAIGGTTWLATTIFEPNAPPELDEDAGGMQRLQSEGVPEGPYLPPEPNPLPATALPDAGVPVQPAAPVDGGAAQPAVPADGGAPSQVPADGAPVQPAAPVDAGAAP